MLVFAYFSDKGVPKTGLSPTLKIIDLADNSVVVSDDGMTEVGYGAYKYEFATFDNSKEYFIRCDGGVVLKDPDRYTVGTTSIVSVLDRIQEIEEGRWKIEDNKLTFYGEDGTTPLVTFNLKDAEGNPTETNVYERVPE